MNLSVALLPSMYISSREPQELQNKKTELVIFHISQ